ncbi:hypothetical protein GQ43DRAFT_440730 [Delitschia confertaspora ATCC 74209]|uniref:Tat pathway signal sequence n=1 Tax=Delitschia confertaspora ATCC 74209 TaxID=1513339 RepID=A0A9P4JLI6_9PLEO|nr:hypothetical protein GQ43DRAFT_440730 [Delitschia confertaspora ATCC 74209]
MSSLLYTKLNSESYHDSSSSTSSLDDSCEEQSWWEKHTSRPKHNQTLELLKILRWPLALTLLTVNAICLLTIIWVQDSPRPLLGEINGLVPQFSQKEVVFSLDEGVTSDHETLESIEETKGRWLEDVPQGNGFIEIKDWQKYRLPPPVKQPNGDPDSYAIAVFHQMHCLYEIMAHVDALQISFHNQSQSQSPTTPPSNSLFPPPPSHKSNIWHINHCFSYLRNALMCCSDTTLEGQGKRDHAGTDGTGATHVCRDYDAVKEWAEGMGVGEGKSI